MLRLRRLGLQRRIMLLVTVGLATMFAIGGFLGLSAIDDAADQVFQERLATAYSAAAIVERDIDRLASEAALVLEVQPRGGVSTAEDQATIVLDVIGQHGRYPFFDVVAVDVLDPRGDVSASVGAGRVGAAARDLAGLPKDGEIAIERASAGFADGAAFADVIVPVASPGASEVGWIVAHTVATGGTAPFDPSRGTTDRNGSSETPPDPRLTETYNLEIIDLGGNTALAIGSAGPVGEPTAHLAAIEPYMASRIPAALVDERAPEAHVMAGVPITGSPFYLLLEQPVDVALALPNQLRQRLFLLIGIGFMAAIAIAWVTTRRVVKPTEELTWAASRMASGDLTQPIDVTAHDEVATLAEALELMRQHLLEAQRELVEVNRDLERRIAERTARLEFVLRRTISAQEEERHALARELHDETAQTIAALTIALDRAREEMEAAPDHGRARIGEAKGIAARLLTETRRLIMGLRPSVLDDLGLGPAITWYAETIMTERDQATDVSVVAPAERLPRHLEVALFRIAQEALNNVAKHSGASRASVRIAVTDDEIELRVEDDGRGFDVATVAPGGSGAGGIGLVGMRERVLLLGGTMDISSEPGSGTVVIARVPNVEEDQ